MTLTEQLQIEQATDNKMTVKICGLTSRNKREYPIHVLQEAMPMYQDHPVYLDHAERQINRKYIERVGHLSNLEIKADGLYAMLNINPHHQLAESLRYDFEHNTKKLGISQVVDAQMAGSKVVKILEVKSVDIVNNPATTRSLKEEEEPEEAPKEEEPKEETHDLQAVMDAIAELKTMLTSMCEAKKETAGESYRYKKPVAIAPVAVEPKSETISEFANRLKRKK